MNSMHPDEITTLLSEAKTSAVDVDERTEIATRKLLSTFAEQFGHDALMDLALTIALPREATMRAMYPPGTPIIEQLDEYHERVRLGLRAPIRF